ncbi:MAG: hypothetical protein H0V71_12170 [Chloroflexi bacterium]|nr:hypothetical protein [Chloroflexota bacterium]
MLAGIAALVGVFWFDVSKAGESLIPEPASLAWRGIGITHARLIDERGRVRSEEWLNRETGVTRRVEYEVVGTSGVTLRETTLQDGTAVVRFGSLRPSRRFIYKDLHPSHPFLVDSSELLRPSRMLDAGLAKVSGAGQVGRRPTWNLTSTRASSRREGTSEFVMEVDQRTLLPIRYMSRTGDGEFHIDVRLEEMSEAELPPDFFSLGKGDWAYRDRRPALTKLPSVVPFRVYTLGPTFEGRRLRVLSFQKYKAESAAAISTEPELFLGYVAANERHVPIVLTEHKAGTDDANARLAAFRESGSAQDVVVDGVERTVFVIEDKTRVYFAVVVGGTLVKGRADLAIDEVVAMLRVLRPLQ